MVPCAVMTVAFIAITVISVGWLAGAPRREVRRHLERMAAHDSSTFLEAFGDADPGTPVTVSGGGPWVQGVHAFQSLGRLAVDPLADALEDPREPVRLAALTGLMGIAPVATDAVPALERAAVHEYPVTRRHALRALVRLGAPGERLRRALLAALDDPVDRVWLSAAHALLELDPSTPEVAARLDRALNPRLTEALTRLASLGLLEGHDATSVRVAAASQLDPIGLLDLYSRNPTAVHTWLVIVADPNALQNPAGPDVVATWVPPRARALGLRGAWDKEPRQARVARGADRLAEGPAPDVYAAARLWNVALEPNGLHMLSLDGGTDDAYFVTVTLEAAEVIRREGLLHVEKGW